ncbi:MAG: 2-oxoacid:acceptor oxidoreductase subunit alpha [Candidatus Komeilibacteria bacterium]|nr:2-oxoacid:acceptor oxidoreductase subunit alpha [Candidatus Komeilibacteria bacterium]
MARYLFSWKIGGEAGFGIKSAGLMFSKMCNRAGFEVFGYDEYPSLIRGGHNSHQVTVSKTPVASTAENIDILVALNTETIKRHTHELSHGGALIYDPATTTVTLSPQLRERNLKLVAVPLAAMTRQALGSIVMRNIVALGATQALVSLPFGILAGVIKKTLAHKQAEIVAANVKAAKLGFDEVSKQLEKLDFKLKLEATTQPEELLLTGNDALSLGALAAGMQMYVAYPMTPSSSILHYLASQAVSQKIVVKHAEDEISVINMGLGASHAGVRTMIGTSGGGFSLMVESLGLAGITETPLVIVEAQRPGPATGLPTWTEQGDLRFVLHAAQGEFPRIVVAPGDHEECFYMTAEAFNWADRYQVPVIILTDKFLAESVRTVLPFDPKRVWIDRGKARMSDAAIARMKDYQRYRVAPDGISPRSIPGQKNGIYLANSDEHDTYGFSNEESANRIAQVRKRAAKFAKASEEINGAKLYGNPRARLTVVGWGSTKGPILDALSWLPRRMQRKINFLHINVVWPFPSEAVHRILKRSKRALLIENNSTAQLGGLIRQQTGIYMEHKMLKFDGRPLYPLDIKERILSMH